MKTLNLMEFKTILLTRFLKLKKKTLKKYIKKLKKLKKEKIKLIHWSLDKRRTT